MYLGASRPGCHAVVGQLERGVGRCRRHALRTQHADCAAGQPRQCAAGNNGEGRHCVRTACLCYAAQARVAQAWPKHADGASVCGVAAAQDSRLAVRNRTDHPRLRGSPLAAGRAARAAGRERWKHDRTILWRRKVGSAAAAGRTPRDSGREDRGGAATRVQRGRANSIRSCCAKQRDRFRRARRERAVFGVSATTRADAS